jgi:hypothetical protein
MSPPVVVIATVLYELVTAAVDTEEPEIVTASAPVIEEVVETAPLAVRVISSPALMVSLVVIVVADMLIWPVAETGPLIEQDGSDMSTSPLPSSVDQLASPAQLLV